MMTVPPPADYNLKLYLLSACVYAALQAADQAHPPRASGQQPGTPKAAVVAGAAQGVRFSSVMPAGPDLTKGPAGTVGGDGGGLASVSMTMIVDPQSARKVGANERLIILGE